MFKRLFWASLGAGAGILAVRKVKRTARKFTPAGVGDQFSALGDAAHDFAEDVREYAAKREFELHAALGLDVMDEPGARGGPAPAPRSARR